MERVASVTELMVPLTEYASVDEDATLEQALQALGEAQKKVPAGRQPYRAVLVRNARGHIVGKIGHFVVLNALLPWQAEQFRGPAMRRAWVTDDLTQQAMDNLSLLQDALPEVCQRARHIRVGDLILRETVTIDHDATLAAAMRKLVEHQTLSLLVRRGDAIIGVLRLSDVFDYLSREVLECGDDRDDTSVTP